MIGHQLDMEVIAFELPESRYQPQSGKGWDNAQSKGGSAGPRPPLVGAARKGAKRLTRVGGEALAGRSEPHTTAVPIEE
jgi:hypothetical protein